MTFKPKIFVGSSSEGKSTAEFIVTAISTIADVDIWSDIFEYGASNFDNLQSQILFYDYAILLATADDVTISRSNSFDTARDNVLFEFGLFAGGLGKEKVIYIVEDGIKIPSDLSGVTLPFIPKKTALNFNDELSKVIEKIKNYIVNRENTFSLSFVPSAIMAHGYFKNFIEQAVHELFQSKNSGQPVILNDKEEVLITNFTFSILIPTDLTEDMYKKISAKRLRHGWKKVKIKAIGVRDFDFSVDVDKAIEGTLELVDVPITLNSLNTAIELYSGKKHIGQTFKETTMERREIRTFFRTLQFLINKSSIARDIVKVELVEI